jgi:adenylosuccinate synthase
MLDRLEEAQRADDEIGTTLRGNGPAYADKVARRGIRMTDLLDRSSLERRLSHEISEKNRILTRVYDEEPLDSAAVLHRLTELGERLRDHIVPAELLVQDTLADGGDVVIECAQGAMLDVDYGIYPFVTSSSPTAAGACQAAGVAPTQVSRVIGVFKAYSTRVGSGPLPTELHDADGQTIRERGNEYGTTTGRPRRTGWFDAVTARYVARLNGLTEVALTLLDVLDPFEAINICTSYKLNQIALDAPTTGSRRSRSDPGYRVQQNEIDYPPARAELWDQISPVYDTLAGWQHDTTGARVAADLPPNAHAYIQSLERAFGTRVTLVGVGPNREQLVPLDEQSAMAATAAATG